MEKPAKFKQNHRPTHEKQANTKEEKERKQRKAQR